MGVILRVCIVWVRVFDLVGLGLIDVVGLGIIYGE